MNISEAESFLGLNGEYTVQELRSAVSEKISKIDKRDKDNESLIKKINESNNILMKKIDVKVYDFDKEFKEYQNKYSFDINEVPSYLQEITKMYQSRVDKLFNKSRNVFERFGVNNEESLKFVKKQFDTGYNLIHNEYCKNIVLINNDKNNLGLNNAKQTELINTLIQKSKENNFLDTIIIMDDILDVLRDNFANNWKKSVKEIMQKNMELLQKNPYYRFVEDNIEQISCYYSARINKWIDNSLSSNASPLITDEEVIKEKINGYIHEFYNRSKELLDNKAKFIQIKSTLLNDLVYYKNIKFINDMERETLVDEINNSKDLEKITKVSNKLNKLILNRKIKHIKLELISRLRERLNLINDQSIITGISLLLYKLFHYMDLCLEYGKNPDKNLINSILKLNFGNENKIKEQIDIIKKELVNEESSFIKK